MADSAAEGYAQIGLGVAGDDLFDQLNDRALQWATDNAADLVTQIDDTSREAVRDAIADGLGTGLTADEISDSIAELGAFDPDRAELIADTEIANANSAGALEGYRAARDSGVMVKKEWLTDADPCPICEENGDAGPIDLEDDFPSGDDAPTAHPNCECALSPVVVDGEQGEESDE